MFILLARSQLIQRISISLSNRQGSSDALTFHWIIDISMLNVVAHRMDYHIKKMPA